MRILIVGCGYLGSHVARILLREGDDDVFGTTRSPSGSKRLESLGIRPIIADVLDPSTWVDLPRFETILYCVGHDRASGVPMRTVYVEGLRGLLDHLAMTNWSGRFVYVSSTGVYGQTGGEWVDETSATSPRHESGIVCLEAEEELRNRLSQAPVSTIRLAGIYGPGRVVRRQAIEQGTPIVGNPERWLNLIHVEDAARVAIASLQGRVSHSLLIACDDHPVRRREYYELTAKLLAAPAPQFLIPDAGSPEAARDDTDKRVSNRLLRQELGFILQYPDITSGLPSALS